MRIGFILKIPKGVKMNTTKDLCRCAFCEFIYFSFFCVTLSREMKTKKTSALLAPAGPLTGGRDDGIAAAPWWRPLPQLTALADLVMRPCVTTTTSAPSTAPAAARAKARASERTPAAAPQRQQRPAPPTTTRPAGAPPTAQQTRPPSADPPRLVGLVDHPPSYWRLKAASQKNHRGRREPVC